VVVLLVVSPAAALRLARILIDVKPESAATIPLSVNPEPELEI